ncbi:MAG: FIST C-terminal domain-containing protein [Nitrospinota bacterium]|nr:FIST C-terminal domain-containing protein [Nitrospinota bacterium]
MIIKVEKSGSKEALRGLMDEVSGEDGVKGLLVLSCDENNFTPESVDEILRGASLPLFGGTFPQIIHGKELIRKGSIVAGLTYDIDVKTISNLSSPENDFDKIVTGLIPETGETQTMFVLVDGYSRRISDLIESLYIQVGLGINYLGGGAGSIDPMALKIRQTPCLFTNGGLVKDSALLVTSPMPSGVGVRHGWSKLEGPFRVTESDTNVIKSLDWRPAFEVYKEAVEKYSGKIITKDNFFDVAKSFPFGISRLGSEIIARDPFAVDDNNWLTVAAEIPSESFVDLLTGDQESLVSAASDAFKYARESFDGASEQQTVLLIDCVSRAMFLGDEFSHEIDAAYDADSQLIGFLSLGEIANSGKDYMELLNKTAVVGVLAG